MRLEDSFSQLNKWTTTQTNNQTGRQLGKRIDGQTDKWRAGQPDRGANGRLDSRQQTGQSDSRTDSQTGMRAGRHAYLDWNLMMIKSSCSIRSLELSSRCWKCFNQMNISPPFGDGIKMIKKALFLLLKKSLGLFPITQSYHSFDPIKVVFLYVFEKFPHDNVLSFNVSRTLITVYQLFVHFFFLPLNAYI